MARTADQLITGLKRRGVIPASQVLFDNDDLLAFADNIIETWVVPMLISVREDYFVTYSDYSITIDQAKYLIPERAVGRSVRDLKLVFSTGGARDLQKFSLEDEHLFQQSATPQGYYMDADNIVLVPTPGVGGQSLRVFYERFPSRLTQTSNAGVATGSTTSSITLQSVPTAITAGSVVDVIRGKAGHSCTHEDLTVQSINTTTLEFVADSIDTTQTAVGDYVSLAQTTPVIQLPNECYSYLETMTAARFLHSNGDFEASGKLEDDAKDEMKNLLKILSPRNRGEATKIINRRSLMRGTKGRYRRGLIY